MTDTSLALPTLVIVSGLPGSGKSTISRRLAAHFSLPLVQKDMIKETLCDVLACNTLSQSQQYGRASMVLLYQFAELLLKSCQSCIVESNFYRELAVQSFQQLQQQCPFSPLQIYCRAELAVLAERVRQRWESGERHRGHMENLRDADWHLSLSLEDLQPLPLAGPLIELDTTDFASLDDELLFARVQDALNASPYFHKFSASGNDRG